MRARTRVRRRIPMLRFSFVPAIVLGLCCATAHATVLYKLTDPAGRVTFADAVPNGFSGSVVRIDVDTSANAIAPVRPTPDSIDRMAKVDQAIAARRLAAAERINRVTLARDKVDAAQAAL